MKRMLLVFLLLVTLFIPINIYALSEDYEDVVSSMTNITKEDGKINLYLFHGEECPHCNEEINWLLDIKEEYNNYLNVYYFEVWHDTNNAALMERVSKELGITRKGVPLTVIGNEYFVGFSDAVASRIDSQIKEFIVSEKVNEVNIPLLGNVDMKDVSIPLVAVILGFIDGFNPCAMWILLFLINMLFKVEDRKKAWILGLTFLSVSGLVYFLSMIGINFVITVVAVNFIKIAIAIFILIAGILNLRKYFRTRKEEAGCTVVDNKKRKKIVIQMKKIINSKSFILSLVGIIILAVSVNLVELACSLGFPLIFSEILAINNVGGLTKIIYLLVYIFFYMIDDMVVFAISMVTLEATGITNKYNKLCTLVSAIIMILMGILLIFKPDYLMLNF